MDGPDENENNINTLGEVSFCDDCGSVLRYDRESSVCSSCAPDANQNSTSSDPPSRTASDSTPQKSSENQSSRPSFQGTVDFFHDRKGYGFIETDASDVDIFFHMEDIGGPDLEEDQVVSFDIVESDEGPRAENLVRGPRPSVDTEDASQSAPLPGYNDLYLIPISEDWLQEFRQTVRTPLSLERVANQPQAIAGIRADRIWAAIDTGSEKKQTHAESMAAGDVVLFYYRDEFIAGGRVSETLIDSTVGDWIWGEPDCQYLFGITDYTETLPPIEPIWEILGFDGEPGVQDFQRVAKEHLEGTTPVDWLGSSSLSEQ